MIGIALKLLGIGRWIWSAIRAGIKWALSDWRHLVIVAVSLFAAYNYIGASKWQGRAERALAAVEARDKTIAVMTAASEASKHAALANAKRVGLEYKEIADNAKITYNRALADNRAAVDRWLQNRRGATGQSDSATATEVPLSVVRDTETAIIPASDLIIVADAYSQLEALVEWARGVESVKTTLPELGP